MTIKQVKMVPHGTKVEWHRPGDTTCKGYVVNLTKSRPRANPPLVYIQWEDGQRTDGSDDWALEHVSQLQEVA